MYNKDALTCSASGAPSAAKAITSTSNLLRHEKMNDDNYARRKLCAINFTRQSALYVRQGCFDWLC